jgi:hypothetical protein
MIVVFVLSLLMDHLYTLSVFFVPANNKVYKIA